MLSKAKEIVEQLCPWRTKLLRNFVSTMESISIDIGMRLAVIGLSLIGLLTVNRMERPRMERGFSFYKEKLKNNRKF